MKYVCMNVQICGSEEVYDGYLAGMFCMIVCRSIFVCRFLQ